MASNISVSISADNAPLRADLRMLGQPAPHGALANTETRADISALEVKLRHAVHHCALGQAISVALTLAFGDKALGLTVP